jgi:acyl-CoA dehydrogenase
VTATVTPDGSITGAPSLDDFTAAARAFLDANAERKPVAADEFVWGEGDDFVGIVEEGDPETELDLLAAAKDWAAKRFDAGFGWIDGPTELGGRGLSGEYVRAYRSLESGYELPDQSIFTIGLGMVAPTIRAHAEPDIAARYLRPLQRGDLIACQLFSEPGAGSDLAAVATTAVRDGDDWVVNGQKVWTSNAHHAGLGEIICRTDPDAPKHAGMTAFLVDMDLPGVEVRPLRQMTGGAGFNEVFFTDVRIPDTQRLGKVGEGWKAALTTLMNERLAVGLPSGGLDIDELMELARDTDLDDGPAIRNQQVRSKIADWYVQQQGLKLTRYRTLTALSKGQTPGPESSIIKIVAAPKMQDLGAFAMELRGPAGIMKEDVPQAAGFQAQWIGGAGFRIAGGTDEILRNIVAERVLGMPADVRVDKDVPFNQLGKK